MTAKLYKIEVPDYGHEELNRLAVAYAAFDGLPFDAQPRCLEWLTERIKDDRRKKLDSSLVPADLRALALMGGAVSTGPNCSHGGRRGS